jgi:PAS domain S-box-containing protein
MKATVPETEAARVAALKRYDILDTPAEIEFDEIAELASQICGTPISLVTLINTDRQWFKANKGLDLAETPRDVSFCAHAILEEDVMIVPDAQKDPRFEANPLVRSDPRIRFYAGAPLSTPDGHSLGTLCVIDRQPRQLSSDQVMALKLLAHQVGALLELRYYRSLLTQELRRIERPEDALREVWDRVRELSDKIRQVFWLSDERGDRLLYISPSFDVFFGRPRHEFTTTRQLLELVHPEDRDISKAARVNQPIEYRICRPDGTIRWMRQEAFVLETSAGDVRRAVMAEDITDAAIARLARRETEESFRLLVDSVTDYAIFALDAEGNVASWNPGAQRIKGYAEDEIIGRHASRFFTPEDIDKGLPEAEQAAALRKGRNLVEGWRVRKDGSRFWASVSTVPLFDESHKLKGFAKVTRDMTERRAAEEALKASEKRFRQTVANLRDALWIMDPNSFAVIYANPAYERIWGRSAESLYESRDSLLDGIHPQDREQFDRAYEEWMKTRQFDEEFRVVRPDGSERWVRGRAFSIRGDDGKLLFRAALGEDVTERRRAHQERQRLQERLVQSEKLELVGRLVGGVAHDFNNLLAIIAASSSLVDDALAANDAAREETREIRNATERAAKLVDQLLSVSRPGARVPEPTDLSEIVAGMESLLRRTLGEDISLVTGLAAVPAVMMDRSHAEQVVLNLVINARDAMPEGGTVRIATMLGQVVEGEAERRSLVGGDYVQLIVSDAGRGMTDEVRAHIFEPFFTTKPAAEGAGLGLATVQGIIMAAGGSIEVASEPGKGTTFWIYLPITEQTPEPRELGAETIDAVGEGKLVLFVEDEQALRRVVRKTLEKAGYSVVEASTPTEALSLLDGGERPQILLTDVVLPEMPGPELAERAASAAPDIATVFISGYAEDELERRAISASRLLRKPFTSTELLNALQQAVAG